MTYELAKELKDAGWPQDHDCIDGKQLGGGAVGACLCVPTMPTLSELIEACGDNLILLKRDTKDYWRATGYGDTKGLRFRGTVVYQDLVTNGSTTEEAVARLWLVLNKKA